MKIPRIGNTVTENETAHHVMKHPHKKQRLCKANKPQTPRSYLALTLFASKWGPKPDPTTIPEGLHVRQLLHHARPPQTSLSGSGCCLFQKLLLDVVLCVTFHWFAVLDLPWSWSSSYLISSCLCCSRGHRFSFVFFIFALVLVLLLAFCLGIFSLSAL